MKKRMIHHLVRIKDSPRSFLHNTYFTGCGLKEKLKDERLFKCSHISIVNCKNCIRVYKSKNHDVVLPGQLAFKGVR